MTSGTCGRSPARVVPFITRWDTEDDLPFEVVLNRGSGIAYADEIATDRDAHGVLWQRTCSGRIMGGRSSAK